MCYQKIIRGKSRKGNTGKFLSWNACIESVFPVHVFVPTLSYESDVLLIHFRVVSPQQMTKRLILCLPYALWKETFEFKLPYTFVKWCWTIFYEESVGKCTQNTFFPRWPAQIQFCCDLLRTHNPEMC